MRVKRGKGPSFMKTHTRFVTRKHQTPAQLDMAGWQFLLFLVFGLLLIVGVIKVANASSGFDLRSKAGLICPTVKMRDLPTCDGGYTFRRDVNGCLSAFCGK
jgi:hypothetical protein